MTLDLPTALFRLSSCLLLAVLYAGCGGADAGSCDETAIDPQAITSGLQRCTSCHSDQATGAARQGAPAGLNFDTAEGRRPHTDLMWSEIKSGRMPPPPPAGSGKFDPDLKEAMRNWLACGAPDPEVGGCDPATDGEWTCLWDDLSTQCLACHSPTTNAAGGGVTLGEAGKPCEARTNLLGVDTLASGMCGGAGQYVVEGDADDSVLIHKVTGTVPGGGTLCGTPMPPLGTSLQDSDPDLVQGLRDWITAGATAPECP